jgi:O-antigen/teichoic acid export membrane protein
MTLGGAAVNVTLNLLLIPHFGAVGAATATLASQSLVFAGFVVTRDRSLVSFPYTEAGLVVATTAAAGAAAWWWGGQAIGGLLAFAGTYALVMAAIWGSRILRPKTKPDADDR